MLADQRSQALVKNFPGSGCFLRNIARIQPDPAAFRISTRTCARDGDRNGNARREHAARRPQRRDLLSTDYTFVISAWRALRHQASTAPSSAASRSPIRSAWTARSSQHPDGHVLSQPDRADDPRKWSWSRSWYAAPRRRRMFPRSRKMRPPVDDHAATHGTAPGQSELRGLSSHDGPARVSRWRISTASAAGVKPRGLGRADRCSGVLPTAPRLTDIGLREVLKSKRRCSSTRSPSAS